MKKTLLTTGLAMALLLSMAFPASAVLDETLPDSDETQAAEGAALLSMEDEEAEEVTISVEVPTGVDMVINPYRIPVEVDGRTVRDTLCMPTQTISSETPRQLAVTVKAVLNSKTGDKDAKLVASPDKVRPNSKDFFIWFEFKAVENGEEPTWSGEYVGTRNQVALNGDSRPVLELPASANGEPSQAAFRAFAVAGVPSSGMWNAGGVSVSLSFEFEVIEDDDASLNGVTLFDGIEELDDIVTLTDVLEPLPEDDEELSPLEDGAEPVESDGASGDAQAVEDGEASDEDEIVTLTDVMEPLSDDEEPVENGDAEAVENEGASDDAEPVESEDASDNAEAVEKAQALGHAGTGGSAASVAAKAPKPVEDEDASDEDEIVTLTDVIEPLSDDEEPVENEDASGDAEAVEDEGAKAVRGGTSSGGVKAVENEKASENAEAVESEDASDDAEPVEDENASDDAEAVEDEDASGDAEAVDDGEASDDEEPVEGGEASGDAEPVDDGETSDDEEASDDAEPVDDGEASDDAQPVDDGDASDDAAPVEGGDATDDAEPVESDDAEAVEDTES